MHKFHENDQVANNRSHQKKLNFILYSDIIKIISSNAK